MSTDLLYHKFLFHLTHERINYNIHYDSLCLDLMPLYATERMFFYFLVYALKCLQASFTNKINFKSLPEINILKMKVSIKRFKCPFVCLLSFSRKSCGFIKSRLSLHKKKEKRKKKLSIHLL